MKRLYATLILAAVTTAVPVAFAQTAPATSEPLAPPPRAEQPAAPAIPWKMPAYTLVAREMNLRAALDTFAVAEGLSIIMSPSVQGVFSGDFNDVPPAEFLDRLATIHNLVWYYDGTTLYVYGSGEISSLLIDLRYMKAGEVRSLLAELGVEDARYPLKTASDDELIMVSGPPRYVALVAEMIEKADALREKRTFNEVETRLFPLENTWAEDVSFTAASPESSGSIKGMATMLYEIVTGMTSPGTREVGATNAPPDTFKPIIKAENRLNAVIVTDVATRMPLYERLIKQLDVPQKLVELAVTVVELSRNDALDWQLSLAAGAARGRTAGRAGQNAGNIFGQDDVAGRGLAGALTYLGSEINVSASLTALREKGKARNISRTYLLTVNNLAAQLSDTQSYHARIIGTEVAELASVSAGTSLKIKPRILRQAETNNLPPRLWLTLSLQDGGFETIAVDSMPMTRSSSLDTQTAIYEGETILLAGYMRDIEEAAGWGIPFLRDIPLIGWLFGGHTTKTETVQRLFLVTPRIVDLDEENLARLQATRLRDISEAEELQDDTDDSAEARERRDLDRQERRELRREKQEDLLKRRKAEIRHNREMRKAERADASRRFEDEKRSWRDEEDALWERLRLEREEADARAAEIELGRKGKDAGKKDDKETGK